MPYQQTNLERVAAGDQSAVRVLVQQYSAPLWTLARRFCPDQAEGAVKDVFRDLWDQACRFDPARSTEATFITMVARRRLKAHSRHHATGQATASAKAPMASAGPAGPTMHGDRVLASAEQVIEDFSPMQQRVMRAAVFDGMNPAGIAQRMDLTLSEVKAIARGGLLQLNQAITNRQGHTGHAPGPDSADEYTDDNTPRGDAPPGSEVPR